MSDTPELFTTRIQREIRPIHTVSDALVNAKFAISLKDETVWGGGLFVFYHVFAFLEDATKRLNMPQLNKLYVRETMYRKAAFEADLTHYLGENWWSRPKPQALENYLEHLQNLEKENPKLLIPYVYHLYMGLISGGQILTQKRKAFQESDPDNVQYSDKVTVFTGENTSWLKKKIKDAMNEIAETMSEDEKDEFMEETNQMFLMNNLMVNTVEGQNRVVYRILFKAATIVLLVVGVIVAYKMNI